MSTTPANRLKLTVLGGFLGSGKTTWLRHQLHEGAMADALVMVNEAASISVDHTILSCAARVVALPGGCACCEGRQAFLGALESLAGRRSGGAPDAPGHLVLETSGLADPGALVEAIRTHPVLIHHIHLDRILVSVDGLHGLDQLRDEPLARAQVEAADRLVVTKTDAAQPEGLARLVSVLAVLNPAAVLEGAAMGSTRPLPAPDPALAAGAAMPAGGGELIRADRLDLEPATEWADVFVWLSALLHARGEQIVRIKGVVRTPAGRVLFQSVRRAVQPPEILPDDGTSQPGDNSLAVIGRGFTPETLARSLKGFTAG